MKPKAKQRQLVSLTGLCLVMGLLGGSSTASIARGGQSPVTWQPLAPSAEVLGQSAALLFHSAQLDQPTLALPESPTGLEEIVPKPITTFHYNTVIPYPPTERTLPRSLPRLVARPTLSSFRPDSQAHHPALPTPQTAQTGPGHYGLTTRRHLAITPDPLTPPDSNIAGFSPATCDLLRGHLGLAKNPRQSEFLQVLLIKGGCS
ncbi:MAG: hypothetical protein VKL98_00660 [Cyanobacteriota bacterium]|nr:hypothetical protein [Cyanobacteriota bacterium]